MTYYPIIIPALNRYSHFKACVESLAACTHASQTELIIGLDYPPVEKYVEGWEKIKNYIPTIKGFKKVECMERVQNYGSMRNSLELQNYALSKYDAYIYTEDDNVFSPAFLDFVDKGLEKYKDNPEVIAVCGYSYPVDWETKYTAVLEHNYFSAWGYGEWGDSRKELLESLAPQFIEESIKSKKSFSNLKKSPKNKIMTVFNFNSKEIPCMDITRSIYMTVKDKYVLMPAVSLVRNTGWDGSGEHCSEYGKKISDIFSNQPVSDGKIFDLGEVKKIEHSKNLEKFQMEIFEHRNLNRFRAFLILGSLRILGFSKIRRLYNFLKRKMKNESN